MIAPGSTIGILGGGQLGRMLILAGRPLGYRFHVYEPSAGSCAAPLAERHFCEAYTNLEALDAFADSVSVVTLEFENIPAAALARLEARVPVRPGRRVLEVAQHRLREKCFLRDGGFPHVEFREVTSPGELAAAGEALGYPIVVKTAAFGYDGKGQQKIETRGALDPERIWETLGDPSAAVVEKWVEFECEVSAVVSRSLDGETRCFPVSENRHRNHILHQSLVPARVEDAICRRAEALGGELAEALGVVGLLAVEFFVTRDGHVLVNELAPRPHNSGHYTQDGCARSQFEQLIRMVAGLPSLPLELREPTVMTNLLGDLWPVSTSPDWTRILEHPDAHLHLYDKGEARPGRKMGHFNLTGSTVESALEAADRIWEGLSASARRG